MSSRSNCKSKSRSKCSSKTPAANPDFCATLCAETLQKCCTYFPAVACVASTFLQCHNKSETKCVKPKKCSRKHKKRRKCPRGAQGFQGYQGNQGNQGAQGFGRQGAQGNKGLSGLQGFQGAQGLIGFQGLQGLIGAQGFQGLAGLQGFQGLQGLGSQGFQGAEGPQGFQGLQGFQGPIGFQGFGLQGLQGFQGAQGDTSTMVAFSTGPALTGSETTADSVIMGFGSHLVLDDGIAANAAITGGFAFPIGFQGFISGFEVSADLITSLAGVTNINDTGLQYDFTVFRAPSVPNDGFSHISAPYEATGVQGNIFFGGAEIPVAVLLTDTNYTATSLTDPSEILLVEVGDRIGIVISTPSDVAASAEVPTISLSSSFFYTPAPH